MNARYSGLRALSLLAGLLLAGSLAGCASDSVGAQSALFEVSPDTIPLGGISEGWQDAPSSCDERLVPGADFKLVDDNVELLAVVDSQGHVICVDTLGDVQDELEEKGRSEEAERLEDRFLLSIGLALPTMDLSAADPTPQPSMQSLGAGEPDDNSGVDQGDPSPQPSDQGPPP